MPSDADGADHSLLDEPHRERREPYNDLFLWAVQIFQLDSMVVAQKYR